MNIRLNRLTGVTLALILAMVLSLTTWLAFVYVPAYAQQEQIELLTSTGEGQNRVLTSGSRNLAPNERHVYRFDYDGNNQPIRVWMNVEPTNASLFQIWTDDMFAQLATTPDLPPMAVGAPLTEGSDFLLWEGGSAEPEIYYVVITSTVSPEEPVTSQYLLNISSLGLSANQSGVVQQEPAPTPITPTTESPTAEFPTPGPTITPTVDPNTVDPNAGAPTVDPNVVVPTVDPNVAASTPDPNVAIVTTAMLNVRTGPSTAYSIIKAVPHSTVLNVLGRDASNTWIAVRLEDGTEGWVTRSLTSYTSLASVVLTPEPQPTPTPIAGGAPVAQVTPGPTIIVVDSSAPKALDGEWQVLGEGETHWYTFQYRGGQLPVHVWMDLEPSQGAIFNILNQETALAILAGVAPNVVNAIGRGTANPVEPGYIFWRASFPEADIFYVMVQHQGPGNVLYSIHAAGPGLGRPVMQ